MEPLALHEAVEALQSPDVVEAHSPLTGRCCFAVRLDGPAAAPDDGAIARVRARLAELPCPTLGLAARPEALSPAAAALVDRLDFVAATKEDLARCAAAAAANPLAAQTLVQLLRLSEGASVADALVAESLAYATLQAGPEFAAWLAARPAPRERAAASGPAVRVGRAAATLELTLDRPAKRNAFSAEMRDALCEALALALHDASVERVRIGAEGPAFCSGGDLDEFGTLPDPATAHAVRMTRSPARLLHELAARTEVVVHGACVGAGVELPAFARRVVARPDASFRLPEVSMGLVPGAGGTVSLPRRIGRQRAAGWVLTGDAIDAPTALAWGLVDAIER